MRINDSTLTTAAAIHGGIPLTIGAQAICSDGGCGQVSRVVIDPIDRAVTHLVVEPTHRQGLARLVPLDLVDVFRAEVLLRCTLAEFSQLDHAEETQFLPASGGHADYPAGQMLSQPYDGLQDTIGEVPQTVTYYTIPVGEVEVRPGEQVVATDGTIGRVQGVVIDGQTHHMTHVLLREGHALNRKEVAIPIGAVTRVDRSIRLNMAKEEVKHLPSTDVARPAWRPGLSTGVSDRPQQPSSWTRRQRDRMKRP
jgi:sporulation protein YlmC with PRC-barrel domain